MQLKRKIIKLSLEKELKNILNKEDQYTIPVFIPHKGCKNECVFCNQKKISGIIKQPTCGEVENIILNRLEDLNKNNTSKKIQIAFFGGSFTGLDIEDQIEYLKIANKFIYCGQVKSIRISTRPDYIDVNILKILKNYNVESIELGVQSLDNDVLTKSKRGHIKEDVIRASRLIKLFGFSLGHQIMIGLPGSDLEKEVKTIKTSLSLGIEDLRIYPVYVINPTELYDMYKRNEYVPLTLEDAIERTYFILKECLKTNVRIIRMGLQSTDEITINNNGMIGPICDNFAEYAMSRIVRDSMEENILNVDKDIDVIIIEVPNRFLSIAVGPKKINKLYFNKKYNVKIEIIGEN